MDNGIDIVLEDEELEVEVQEDFLKGDKGGPGYTPVRGIDYYTEQDKQELIDELTEDIQGVKNDFNTNVATKTNEFNANVVSKTTEFNNNATNKMAEFNANTITKINEYNENAEDLINRVIEAEAENERLKQDLNGLPSGQAEGETIDITDSAEMRFSKFNISGNSKQETREGYNELLNTAKRYTTDKGIIATFKEDGTIIVSGTATGTVDIQLCGEWASTVEQFKLTAGNYKYTSNNTGLKLYLANNTSAIYFSDNEVKALEDYSVTNAFIRIENGVTINSTIKPMLYLYQGTEREYEQYGVSPSPDYQSEVEACGDNVNLLQLTLESQTINGITVIVNEDKSITLNGTATAYSVLNLFEGSQKLSNGTYTINLGNKNSGINLIGMENEAEVVYLTAATSDKSVTRVLTTETTLTLIKSAITKGTIFNNFTIYPKLEKSTTPTLYSPYGLGCISEVVCNKNLLDFGKDSYTNYGLTITLNKNNYTINGTSNTIGNWFKTKGNISGHIYLGRFKAGTYIASSKTKSGTYNTATWTSYFRNGNKESYGDFARGNKTQVIELTEDTDLYFQIYGQANTVFNNLSVDLQLEKSSNATEIIEPQSQTYTISTQQPMRSVGDTFVKVNNKWFERHYGARRIFDGTEDWEYNYNCFRLIDNSVEVSNSSEKGDLKSNYFIVDTQLNLQNAVVDYGISTRAGSGGFVIRYKDITVLADFKAWLTSQYNAGTPVYIDYVLATPLDIECTEEQSTILWDIEQNAKTYKNITHMYSTDEISPVIEVTYKKDIEKLFANTLVESGV